MKACVVVKKKTNKICREFGIWEDPGDAFRSLSEMSEDVSKYNVIVYNLKKLYGIVKPNKTLDGAKSEYYYESEFNPANKEDEE